MSFNSDSNANKFKKSYFNGFVDTNNNVIARDKLISNNLQSLSGSLYIGTDNNSSNIYIGDTNTNVNINGTLNYINTTNLEVTDKLIRLGKGSINCSNSGIEIEENGNIASYIKINDNKSEFIIKYPNDGNSYDMITRKNLESNISDIDHHIILDGGCQQDYVIGGSLNIGGRLSSPTIYTNKLITNDNFIKLSGSIILNNNFQLPLYRSINNPNSIYQSTLNLNSLIVGQTIKFIIYPYIRIKFNFSTTSKIFFNHINDLYYNEYYIASELTSIQLYYKNELL